jgi:hypothetical protein
MDGLVELLWDSGTEVVQGQSSRHNTDTSYSYKSGAFTDGGLALDETKEKKKMSINKVPGALPEILQFGSPEPLLDPDFFSLPGTPPSHHHDRDRVGDRGADTDTDTVPWIDYPILGTSHRSSEGELQSNLNPNPNPPLPLHPEPPKPLDIQSTVPVQKSGQDEASCSNKKPSHLHLQGGGLGVGLINFSHFLRPVALAKATLQSAERLRSNEKASTSYNNSSTLQSMVIQSASTLQPPSKLSSLSKPQTPFPSSPQNKVDASNHCGGNNNVPPPSSQPAQRIELLDKEKEREKPKEKEKGAQPVLAPASVCSRNVDPKNKLKRKSLEDDNTVNSDEVCNNIHY